MKKREILTFGEDAYPIRQLTIRQLEEISDLIETKSPGIAMAHGVIAIGLRRDHPLVDVSSIEATPYEVKEGMRKVLTVGGFAPTNAAATD